MDIVEYDEIRAQLDEVKSAANFIPDVTTDEGYGKSKRVSLDIGKLLTALDKARKAKKEYFLEGGRQVDSQAKAIKAELEEYQLPHKEAYKELDNLKKEREAKRKAELEARVEFMRTLAESMADSHSSEIQCAMQQMQDEECLDFYEYTEQALKARNGARNDLGALFAKVSKAEAEAIELERLRKESAGREQKDREDRIAREASAKAEAAEKEAIERARLAELDKIEADKRAAQAEKDAAKNAEIAAEQARNAEVARQQEMMRIEAEAQAKREADTAHISSVRRAAKEALMLLGLDEPKAKAIIIAINNGSIPCVTINY